MAWIVSWIFLIILMAFGVFILLFSHRKATKQALEWLGWLTVIYVVVGVIPARSLSRSAIGNSWPHPKSAGIEGLSNIYATKRFCSPCLSL